MIERMGRAQRELTPTTCLMSPIKSLWRTVVSLRGRWSCCSKPFLKLTFEFPLEADSLNYSILLVVCFWLKLRCVCLFLCLLVCFVSCCCFGFFFWWMPKSFEHAWHSVSSLWYQTMLILSKKKYKWKNPSSIWIVYLYICYICSA